MQQYVVRKPSGDPDTARRLASAYDGLADTLMVEIRHVVGVLDDLGAQWRGKSARASRAPEHVLSDNGARVARALRHNADNLRHYSTRLARAHEHHSWSIGKLVTLGAVVTVGVAAVVITVGAATPVEAAAAAAAVEGAETATASVGAAAASLTSWQTLLATVRPMAAFVTPHLVSAASSAGLDAISQLLDGRDLDPRSIEVAAAVGFAGSSTGATAERALAGRGSAVRRLAEGGLWAANGTAGAYADEGSVDPLDSLAFGLTGAVARDVRRVFGL